MNAFASRTFRVILGAGLAAATVLGGYVLLTALEPGRRIGFQHVLVGDSGHPAIPVDIWYPATARPGWVQRGSRFVRAADDAPVEGAGLPLIIMSHGMQGSSASHIGTAIALAAEGFVVAVPTHPGDNHRDSSLVGRPGWLEGRSRHVALTTDFLLDGWKDRGKVDPERIGIFGFSVGATTALIAAGGKPDFRKLASQCSERPQFLCRVASPELSRRSDSGSWSGDRRIKAAVLVAPAFGFAFEPHGLSDVRVPVQLWAGGADRIVPFGTNAGTVGRLLPTRPETHIVRGATHSAFDTPDPLDSVWSASADRNGFDERALHAGLNNSVIRFFRSRLSTKAGARP